MSCGIYKIENLINHKIYIGQSIEIEKRFQKHLNANDNFIIHKALKKYGKQNFSFQILEECEVSELNNKEIYWINYYNSLVPNGYNMIPGGSNGAGYAKGKKILQYDLNGKFIAEFPSANQASKATNINQSSICACARGEIIHTKNFQWKYKDSNKIISKINIIDIAINKREILQYNLQGELIQEYSSLKEAAEKTQISKSIISKVCNHKGWTAGGYFWCYKEDINRLQDFKKKKKIN